MEDFRSDLWVDLDIAEPVWSRFFTVAPLVVIGTREGDHYNLAPKHMVTALGQDNYFGFVCTPQHSTYHNVKTFPYFSVSFITPDQVVMPGLAAMPRCADNNFSKDIIDMIPTMKADQIDVLCVEASYLCLECTLDRIIDGFGTYSLIAGKICAVHVRKEAVRISDGDDEKLIREMPLMAYLAYGRYAQIDKSLPFPFPKDFKSKVLPS